MYKILILEDNHDDIALIRRELKSAGLEFDLLHVDDKKKFAEALESWAPNLVLADYGLPDFNGLEALTILRDSNPAIPFILVSGTIGKEVAAEVVLRGATNYVMKNQLGCLSDVVKAALDGTKEGQRVEEERELALSKIEHSRKEWAAWGDEPVRVLFLEDTEDDVVLLKTHLKKELPNFVTHQADSESEFRQQLNSAKPDIILADFSLPSFDGLAALSIRQELCPDVPFIFVSSIIGEDIAIESLKLGVTDYVMKDKPSRLGPVVRRALAEAREKRLHQDTERHLHYQLKEQVTNLERLNAELEAARLQAEQALVVKSRFVATVSHEIRTPMSGVLGMAELLMLSELDGEPKVLAEHILHSANNLMTIVNDILDFSKLDAGKLQLERRAFKVDSVLEQVLQSIAPAAASKKLELDCEIDDRIPAKLFGDEGRIRQTLLNLAHNAIKFTECGSVKISAQIESTTDDTVRVKFSVTDSGIGIDKDVQKKLFLPFVQADSSTTRRYGGTGLGLSICKNLVSLMSGDIDVNSKEGEGSTFWFTLPLQLSNSKRAPSPRKTGQRLKTMEPRRANC